MTDTSGRYMTFGADGAPLGVVDLTEIQCRSTILMYQLAAVAGDNKELNRLVAAWLESVDADNAGLISATTLSLMVRNVVAPLLDVLATVAPEIDLRAKLRESRDYAQATLGGGV
ncbi:hypothetical protein [Nocardia sp. NBC_00403]|uniref:hypothetical protein n=1 Tax=Nocardia sp. NBC_00403 TaxID=2975990 RepID=UPI002E1F4397